MPKRFLKSFSFSHRCFLPNENRRLLTIFIFNEEYGQQGAYGVLLLCQVRLFVRFCFFAKPVNQKIFYSTFRHTECLGVGDSRWILTKESLPRSMISAWI